MRPREKERESMKMKFVASAVALACMGLASLSMAAEATGKTSLDNLQTAFNGESNAKARYEAFAAKATEEGYNSVATLFRAAAASEAIHAQKHAAAIQKLGAEPQATVAAPEVKSTAENIAAALSGENMEKQTMYPAFVAQAQAEGNTQAMYSFKGAMAAEAEHALLFAQALSELDAWKPAGKAFYVCQVCGYTQVNDLAVVKCIVCAAPRGKFTIFQ